MYSAVYARPRFSNSSSSINVIIDGRGGVLVVVEDEDDLSNIVRERFCMYKYRCGVSVFFYYGVLQSQQSV